MSSEEIASTTPMAFCLISMLLCNEARIPVTTTSCNWSPDCVVSAAGAVCAKSGVHTAAVETPRTARTTPRIWLFELMFFTWNFSPCDGRIVGSSLGQMAQGLPHGHGKRLMMVTLKLRSGAGG